jgi:hypothetical protein
LCIALIPADQGKGAELFRVPVDGGPAIQLVNEPVMNPVWSPDGQFLVYAGVEVGTRFSFKAATADGKPHRTPEITVPTENLIRDIRALKQMRTGMISA